MDAATPEAPAQEEAKPKQKYWAAEPDKLEFGKKLVARLDECRTAVTGHTGGHLSSVGIAYTHYYGQDIEGVGASSKIVTRSGEQGEVAEVRIPQVRALAAGVLNIVTGSKVAWQAVAVNNDHKSRAACVVAAGALEYYWKDRGVYARGVLAALEAILFGEGFVFAPWDETLGQAKAGYKGKVINEGDIGLHNVSTWDVLRDPHYTSFDACPWLAVTLWQNKYDIAAEHPEAEAQAMSAPAHGVRWTPCGAMTGVEPETIPVTYWFHKKTPAVPFGRQVVALDDGTILSDEPLSKAYWKHLPIHRMWAGELLGSPFPDTSFWSALSASQIADSIHTSLSTNITSTAAGVVAAESDSEVASNSIAGGPKILYYKSGGRPPTSLTLQQASESQFKYLDTVRREAMQILSLNSASLGEPESKNLSGEALALLSSMSIQNNSNLQGNWVEFITRLGNGFLALFQEKVTTPRKIAIVGSGRASAVKSIELNGAEQSSVDRVMPEIGNPLQQTAAGRLELAKMYLQIPGMVKTPEQVQGVVDTGRLEPLTQDLSNELLIICEENEALAKGTDVGVILTDNHRLHIREHPGVGASMEARSNSQVMKVLQAHIAEHIRVLRETDPAILMALGQEPIAMAPPGAPPPGAPGAEGQPAPDVSEARPPAPSATETGTPLPDMPTNPATGEKFTPANGAPVQ